MSQQSDSGSKTKVLSALEAARRASQDTVQQAKTKTASYESRLDAAILNMEGGTSKNGSFIPDAYSLKMLKHLRGFVAQSGLKISDSEVLDSLGDEGVTNIRLALRRYYKLVTEAIRSLCVAADVKEGNKKDEPSEDEKLVAELRAAVNSGDKKLQAELLKQLTN